MVTRAVHDDPALPALGRVVLEGVARCLRHQPQLKDALLIAMTGYRQDSDYQRSQ
jgi:hypothetical protein